MHTGLTPTPPQIEEEVTTEVPPRNIENAVYNDLTGMWMIPQADPYTLENFQAAYDNLASGKSLQTLTRAEEAEFAEPEQLKPTHFALRIYPKTEDEQWQVEMMEDVNVVYTPFNYSGLTEEEVAQVPQTCAEIASPFEVSPYTVTYENYESTDGVQVESRTLRLPVLYVVWPASKPLPDDLEYKVDYEVFLPHEAPATRSDETMQLLEIEATALALGSEIIRTLKPVTRAANCTVTGMIKAYDSVLGQKVPMSNLRVGYRLGSFISHIDVSETDDFGYFAVSLRSIVHANMKNKITVSYCDLNGHWRIMDGNSTVPRQIVIDLGNPKNGENNYNLGDVILPAGDRHVNEIYRAANYFYNEQTVFTKPAITGGINIIANSTSNPSAHGEFYYHPTFLPYIEIYNNGQSSSNVLGTVLHELGHAAHYAKVGYNNYSSTHRFLRESFASYSGWYFGEEYYKSLDWMKPTGYSDITGNARQEWYKELGVTVMTSNPNDKYYSPLFIDLTDTFDQRELFNYSTERPNDWIESVSPSVVWNIITTSRNWAQCKNNLQRYVAMPDELQLYLLTAGYDYWFRYN